MRLTCAYYAYTNKTTRLANDFRFLNSQVKRKIDPLSNAQDLFKKIEGIQCATTLCDNMQSCHDDA